MEQGRGWLRRIEAVVRAVALAAALVPLPAWAGCMTCEPDDPPPPPYAAAMVSQSVPTSMVAGQTYAVSVQMQNNGTMTWTAANAYRLGSQNPIDNTTWGLGRVNVAGTILQDQVATFAFNVVAPSTPGTYNFQWKMVRDGVTWFGAPTTNVAVTVVANALPSISLTAPASGQSFQTGSALALTANASDSDGTVQRVEFWVDGVLLAQDTSAPYAATWSVAAGSHAIVAKAFDNFGASRSSATATVTGFTPNVPPSVSLTSPANGQAFTGGSVALSATASDSDGTVQRVEFWVDGAKWSEDTASPYAGAWTSVAGTHTVSAKAFDNSGASTASSTVSISVNTPPAPPTTGTLTRRFVYNAFHQLCKVIDPESGATVMHYDAAGNLDWTAAGLLTLTDPGNCNITEAQASGRRVDRTYDARSRPTSLVFPDHNGDQTWTYTPDGLPAQVTTLNGGEPLVNAYVYNRRRSMTGESVEQPGWYTWSIGYGYDANGNVATLTHPGGEVVSYAPNGLGQATKVTSNLASYATGVTYHPNGAIERFTYGNGVVHTLALNLRMLPDRSRDAPATGTAIIDDSYDYDANEHVVAISDGLPHARGNRTMVYDDLNRLTSATSPMYGPTPATYRYDVLDNIVEVQAPGRQHTYWYDNRNHLTNVQDALGNTVIGLGYDDQGNLANKSGKTFQFDFGNRLRSVTYASGTVEAYRYDANGRRTLAWAPAIPGSNILSMYDSEGALRYQHDVRKSLVYNYIYLGGSLVAVRETPVGGSVHAFKYQHTDGLHTPIAVTDAAGAVLERSEYEPFGALLNRPIHDGPGFGGHVIDAQTGMVYMQQRYYDPLLGRFLSVDPVSVSNVGGNFNRYWYANNNPYGFIDPDGRQAKTTSDKSGTQKTPEQIQKEEEEKKKKEEEERKKREREEKERQWKELLQAVNDGHLTLSEARAWYQQGKGGTITVDASRLTVVIVKNSDGSTRYFVKGIDYAVHGNVRLDANGQIVAGFYNFEIHKVRNGGDVLRNALNYAGRAYTGVGTPFLIQYTGQPKVLDYRNVPKPTLPRLPNH
jgi:RHS repeat-associated protein